MPTPHATRRLSLRELTLQDVSLMLAIWNDPAFVRFVGNRGIRSSERAREAIREGALRLYADFGYGPYLLRTRKGEEIGICGLFRRDEFEDPDLGFALLPPYRGAGYAHEAAQSVVHFAREALRLPRLLAIVAPENVASVGLLEKLGFRFLRSHRMAGEEADVSLYELDASAT